MIYFHIPFCKQACHYCDFHFSTSMKYKEEMLHAMKREIAQRAHYLDDKNIHSIYFGGGTPSLLTAEEIQSLIGTVEQHFHISNAAEITLEANPDDLTKQHVNDLRHTPINRFSIGIQSFYEEDLRWMNRAHNAQEAQSAIMRVQDAGFENITCDLIYGYPLLSDSKWASNMQQLIDMEIPHISSYAMTVEHKTALAHHIKQGAVPPMDEVQSAAQMTLLIETLGAANYEHYEISNFAKHNRYAQHNTNYWKGAQYLGIGPSAHSFNGSSRSWNIANNAKYTEGIRQEQHALEVEILSKNDQFNEYVMTSIRTMWGLDMRHVEHTFGYDYRQHILRESKPFRDKEQLLLRDEHTLYTSSAGKLMADLIASELFRVEED